METIQFKILLEQVDTLNNHYKRINDLTGENFNIFRILKLESSEVRLHSAFLAELLNPKGNHGQKDIFLKLFVDLFCFKKNSIDTESCRVDIEKHTGFISEDQTEGGRIDIIITDKFKNKIVIENKIYAGDQKNQLLRYHKYAQNADLIYLTLDGRKPQEKSYGNLLNDMHFKCYSYESHILNWLDKCRKEVAVFPIIRESITQYINLIKYLTNQTLNDNMQMELAELIKSNLEASFLIAENFDRILDNISYDFGLKIKNKYQDQGLLCDYNVDLDKRHTGLSIYKNEWKNVRIRFAFEDFDKKLIYGFATIIDPNNFSIPVELREKLSLLPNNTNRGSAWWPWYKSFEEPYNDWTKLETWQAISDGTLAKAIEEKVELLLKLTEGMEL
jgi:hypothetical protein